jgi:hypothetical protein
MKQPKHRFSNRVIEIDAGIYVVRFVAAAHADAASVTISVVPGSGTVGSIQMLGDIDGGTGVLRTPGSVLVVKADTSVQLLATIMARIDVLKPNVRIDVERLDGVRQSAPAQDATGKALAEPVQQMSDPLKSNVSGDLSSAPQRETAGTAAKDRSMKTWMGWPDRPPQVMLSMAVAQTPEAWSPPRLAEDVDLDRMLRAFGFRWAIVGPGRQDWQLQAKARLTDGSVVEASGQNVVVPRSFGSEILAADLFVRRLGGGDWVHVLEWHKEAAEAAVI